MIDYFWSWIPTFRDLVPQPSADEMFLQDRNHRNRDQPAAGIAGKGNERNSSAKRNTPAGWGPTSALVNAACGIRGRQAATHLGRSFALAATLTEYRQSSKRLLS